MSDLPPIIGICGAIGAGKDTAADGLKSLGYQRLSFASALKEAVATMFPWVPRCHFFGTQAEKAEVLFYTSYGGRWTGRKLLHIVGTDYMRAIMPDIWVRAAMEQVDRHPKKLWVVSDVRFPNEAQAIRERGGVVWEVIREGGNQEVSHHVSDNAYLQLPKDATLRASSGDVTGLQRAAILLAKNGGRVN